MKLDENGMPVFEREDFPSPVGHSAERMAEHSTKALHAWLKGQPVVYGISELGFPVESWHNGHLRNLDDEELSTHTAFLVGIRKIGGGE